VGPLVVDRRGVQGQHPVLRADGDPRLHEAGRIIPGPARSVVAAGPSARWVSRSTPRRGSGITRTSAAVALRSSTRGGRPRPGRSSSRHSPA
jgi:hypothetical protein